jgi:argininosuccinate lyase
MGESKKLWGGRFTGEADPGFVEFNRSFKFDRRLLHADVRGSVAHCDALLQAGVLTTDEAARIKEALEDILARGEADPNYLDDANAEDVHSFVEARLIEEVGDIGRKLHTGRSRNDQVATDLRLWLRDAVDELERKLKDTQSALLTFAESNLRLVMPGYTHLQPAQPILLAHWALAYFEMLTRDRERFLEVRKRVNVMPLGSGALAGTSFPIDRDATASRLDFAGVNSNSLDGVSDRDFCLEFLAACSIVMVHLSRLAEDVILYSTNEFGFFELSDAVATGSSLMPQKKNPDSLELVRGKAGRVFGDLQALLVTMKGLPLAYNKDMQEDKEAVFDAFDTVHDCLEVSSIVLRNVRVNESRTANAASKGYMNATELADYLVRKGVPFREAHETVGQVVVRAIELGVELNELPMDELKSFGNLFEADVYEALSIERTLATKAQTGGTSREQVERALKNARSLV